MNYEKQGSKRQENDEANIKKERNKEKGKLCLCNSAVYSSMYHEILACVLIVNAGVVYRRWMDCRICNVAESPAEFM
jgi:hypothetical protein